jgi:DNA-directed RNA polymerase subunit M/transcription elongation factor TFIIS
MESLQRGVFGLNGATGRPFHPCSQCGAAIIASSWSEHVNERCIRDVWTCDTCGYEFETSTVFRTPERALV